MATNNSKYENQLAEFYSKMDEYNFVNPNVSFHDDICFNFNGESLGLYDENHDFLYINSKIVNGENLFNRLCFNYYYYGMNLVTSKHFNLLHPIIGSFADKKTGKHSIAFDYYISLKLFFTSICDWVGDDLNIAYTILDQENPFAFVRDYLRLILRKVNDVIEHGKESQYYDLAYQLVTYGQNIKPATLEKETLFGLRDVFESLIIIVVNMKKNKEVYSSINLEEFKNCFNIDKLYLIIAKSILEQQKYDVKKENKISDSYYQLLFYINCLLKDDFYKKYNPSIKIYNENTESIEKYSVMDLLREFKSLVKLCEEKNIFVVSADDLKNIKLDSADDLDDLFKLLSSEDEAALKMSWTFIKAGEIQNDASQKDDGKEVVTDDVTKESVDVKEIKTNKALYHKYVMDKTKFKCKIVGKEKFAGYIGYIYDNGLVVFEKIYKDNMKGFETKSNATYIMNFVNFAKFTKLDKQELIQYIKSTDNPEVKRVYHSKKWENKIISIINGLEYNDEINQLIDAFIETQHDYKFN